ncbi:MAG: energy transducer TonB [Prevotella sp.]|nr:energy transducer TonB [Prevotella sp.]
MVSAIGLMMAACSGNSSKNAPADTTDSIEVEEIDNIEVSGPDSLGIYDLVKEMPAFEGGDEALMKWLGDNINYPQEAQDKKIEGRVEVRFFVNEEGKIEDATVVRSVNKLLDEEAMRVVNAMPAWKPGTVDGQPVKVWFTLPVTFQLK